MAARSTAKVPAPGSKKPQGTARDLDDPALYVNRELGLLSFQGRVLEEARDASNPLLERVKFLAIVGSNLNEFFMVRVASLNAQLDAGIAEFGPDRMSPSAQLVAIRREVKRLVDAAHQCLEKELRPALAEEGIHVVPYHELNAKQLQVCKRYFSEIIFPVLTPLAFDPGRPFPHISNLSLNLAVLIRDAGGDERFARVKVPDSLPALVSLTRVHRPSNKRTRTRRQESYVWMEEVIAANLDALFPGMEIVEAHPFHVTRDADIAIKELEADDLLETIEEGVRQRRVRQRGAPAGESGDAAAHPADTQVAISNSTTRDVYRGQGAACIQPPARHWLQIDRPDLKYKPVPAHVAARSSSPTTDEEDIFTLHPASETSCCTIPSIRSSRWSSSCARRRAIRTCWPSRSRSTASAAIRPWWKRCLKRIEEGKQVAVLVELKARFDEESNIEWAKALENAGVHVVYGLVGLKVHSKVAMVVRREGDAIRRYVHLATGNYNAVTAHLYTDIGMFTCDREIAADATDLFNYLTGYSAKADYQKLLVAPVNLRERAGSPDPARD